MSLRMFTKFTKKWSKWRVKRKKKEEISNRVNGMEQKKMRCSQKWGRLQNVRIFLKCGWEKRRTKIKSRQRRSIWRRCRNLESPWPNFLPRLKILLAIFWRNQKMRRRNRTIVPRTMQLQTRMVWVGRLWKAISLRLPPKGNQEILLLITRNKTDDPMSADRACQRVRRRLGQERLAKETKISKLAGPKNRPRADKLISKEKRIPSLLVAENWEQVRLTMLG